jgi:hypothetical protein
VTSELDNVNEELYYPELEPEADADAEDKGDGRTIITQSKDWTISSLREKHDNGKLDLQPRYQRQYVWELKPELPSRLIESLLLNIPVPPLYFAEMPGNRMEVIDGQQRLTTIIHYVKNEFPLQKLLRLTKLNGKYFKDLPEEYQEKLKDSPIHSVVIARGSDPDLRYEVLNA